MAYTQYKPSAIKHIDIDKLIRASPYNNDIPRNNRVVDYNLSTTQLGVNNSNQSKEPSLQRVLGHNHSHNIAFDRALLFTTTSERKAKDDGMANPVSLQLSSNDSNFEANYYFYLQKILEMDSSVTDRQKKSPTGETKKNESTNSCAEEEKGVTENQPLSSEAAENDMTKTKGKEELVKNSSSKLQVLDALNISDSSKLFMEMSSGLFENNSKRRSGIPNKQSSSKCKSTDHGELPSVSKAKPSRANTSPEKLFKPLKLKDYLDTKNIGFAPIKTMERASSKSYLTQYNFQQNARTEKAMIMKRLKKSLEVPMLSIQHGNQDLYKSRASIWGSILRKKKRRQRGNNKRAFANTISQPYANEGNSDTESGSQSEKEEMIGGALQDLFEFEDDYYLSKTKVENSDKKENSRKTSKWHSQRAEASPTFRLMRSPDIARAKRRNYLKQLEGQNNSDHSMKNDLGILKEEIFFPPYTLTPESSRNVSPFKVKATSALSRTTSPEKLVEEQDLLLAVSDSRHCKSPSGNCAFVSSILSGEIGDVNIGNDMSAAKKLVARPRGTLPTCTTDYIPENIHWVCHKKGYEILNRLHRGTFYESSHQLFLACNNIRPTYSPVEITAFKFNVPKKKRFSKDEGDTKIGASFRRMLLHLDRLPPHHNLLMLLHRFSKGSWLFQVTCHCPWPSLQHLISTTTKDVVNSRFEKIFLPHNLSGGLPEDSARTIFRQICAGMEHLHDYGILHGDLKCSNILVTDRLEVKLTGYGPCCQRLVNSLSQADHGSSRTSVEGASIYTPPEIMNKRKTWSKACDVWCMGVALLQMTLGDISSEMVTALRLSGSIRKMEKVCAHSVGYQRCLLIDKTLQACPTSRPPVTAITNHAWLSDGTDLAAAVDKLKLRGGAMRTDGSTFPRPKRVQCVENPTALDFYNIDSELSLSERKNTNSPESSAHLKTKLKPLISCKEMHRNPYNEKTEEKHDKAFNSRRGPDNHTKVNVKDGSLSEKNVEEIASDNSDDTLNAEDQILDYMVKSNNGDFQHLVSPSQSEDQQRDRLHDPTTMATLEEVSAIPSEEFIQDRTLFSIDSLVQISERFEDEREQTILSPVKDNSKGGGRAKSTSPSKDATVKMMAGYWSPSPELIEKTSKGTAWGKGDKKIYPPRFPPTAAHLDCVSRIFPMKNIEHGRDVGNGDNEAFHGVVKGVYPPNLPRRKYNFAARFSQNLIPTVGESDFTESSTKQS